MKKIISILLITVIAVLALGSCELLESSPEEMLRRAESRLADKPYKITTSISVSSDDEALNAALSANSSVEIPVIIDGDNMMVDMSYDGSVVTMSVIDNVAYYRVSYGTFLDAKYKVNLTEMQRNELTGASSELSSLTSYTNFETVEMTLSEGGKVVITCKGMSESAVATLKAYIAETFLDMDVEDMGINIDDIELSVTLNGKEFDSISLSCDYTMSYFGREVKVTMTATMDYEFDGVEAIVAPSDAGEYIQQSYDEIFG